MERNVFSGFALVLIGTLCHIDCFSMCTSISSCVWEDDYWNKPVNQYEHCPDVIVLNFITYFLCQQWSEDNQKSIDGQNISKNPLNDDAIYLRIKTMIFFLNNLIYFESLGTTKIEVTNGFIFQRDVVVSIYTS